MPLNFGVVFFSFLNIESCYINVFSIRALTMLNNREIFIPFIPQRPGILGSTVLFSFAYRNEDFIIQNMLDDVGF